MSRNIEELRANFLGGDPAVETTLSANSLRLIGIPGELFALKPDLEAKYRKAKEEWEAGDKDLQEQIDNIDILSKEQIEQTVEQYWPYGEIDPHGEGTLAHYVRKDGDTMTGALWNRDRVVISTEWFSIGPQPGFNSLSVGDNAIASGTNAVATGKDTLASGEDSFATGRDTQATRKYAVASGMLAEATGFASHAEGGATKATEAYSHAEGQFATASGENSHAEGGHTTASGESSHASGYYTTASGRNSHAEGSSTIASGGSSHAEGGGAIASGNNSHAEGYKTYAYGIDSHTEGRATISSSGYAHAEGDQSIASGLSSHAEGGETIARGSYSHAEGTGGSHTSGGTATVTAVDGDWVTLSTTDTINVGDIVGVLAQHKLVTAIRNSNEYLVPDNSFEAGETVNIYAVKYGIASGDYSHVQNKNTNATGEASTSCGSLTFAEADNSITSGNGTDAYVKNQVALGSYNDISIKNLTAWDSTDDVLVVGNGVSGARSNALRLAYSGDLYIAGTLHSNGADYAETTEWLDGNPNNEDRAGYFVCMAGNKMRKATSQDVRSRIGVVSAFPSVLGDSYNDYWHGKYVTDVFGRIQREVVNIPERLDEEGNVIDPASSGEVGVISQNYDSTQTYIPRMLRPEFGAFAMLGKLIVIDDGTCQVDGYCYPNDSGIATAENDVSKGFYVMERIDQTHIKILLK